jgi:translation initiation factor IF-2
MTTERIIHIGEYTTVGNLAETLGMPPAKLIGELFKNGIAATVNERLDFDTATIILAEIDADIKIEKIAGEDSSSGESKNTKTSRHELSDKALLRPPVIAIMGHVDHGKTSLLDAIRGASVALGEAGGITQHISAYQVVHNGRPLTFLDTPGHEAFAAIREHGARLTDLVVIVIAADDGIKPQTIEAIRFAKQANAKIVVALNKMDKEGADVNKAKQQMSEHGLMVEEWGGDIIAVPVSAKTKVGLEDLLSTIILLADVEELKADFDSPPKGLVIEAHMETGKGPIATVLVEHGKIKRGDFIVAGSAYAKIKTMTDSSGNDTLEAGPSTPVSIMGFKGLPQFGDDFYFIDNEKEAKSLAKDGENRARREASSMSMSGSELLRKMSRKENKTDFNIVIKADVQGSLVSVVDSLKSLDTDEVAVRIVGSGIGNVTESDVHMAHSSGAVIYGFNIDMSNGVRIAAGRDDVSVRKYKIIYELIDDVKAELTELLAPEVRDTDMGRLLVKGIFKTSKDEVIVGGEVTVGRITPGCLAKIIRDKELVAEAVVKAVRRGPVEAKEVLLGEMCGLLLTTTEKLTLLEGDRIECFTRETIKRTL